MKKRLYLYKSGTLSRQDNSLVFSSKTDKQYLPVHQLETINVFNHCNINKNTVLILYKHGISLNFFDYYGNYKGSFIPKNYVSGDHLIKQVNFIKDENKKLFLAKEIIDTSIVNMLNVLKYYLKKGRSLNLHINSISILRKNIETVDSINKLILDETKIKKLYYNSFDSIILNKDFVFEHRTKHPPENPVNAMMSYGYSLLYSLISNILYRSHLHISLSVIHGLVRQKEGLKYDIADIFKPVIIDRIIFRLINKRMINLSMFENNGVATYLNKEGARVFIEEYENTLASTVKTNERTLSYRSIISREVHNISKHILDNKPYKGYKMRW